MPFSLVRTSCGLKVAFPPRRDDDGGLTLGRDLERGGLVWQADRPTLRVSMPAYGGWRDARPLADPISPTVRTDEPSLAVATAWFAPLRLGHSEKLSPPFCHGP